MNENNVTDTHNKHQLIVTIFIRCKCYNDLDQDHGPLLC